MVRPSPLSTTKFASALLSLPSYDLFRCSVCSPWSLLIIATHLWVERRWTDLLASAAGTVRNVMVEKIGTSSSELLFFVTLERTQSCRSGGALGRIGRTMNGELMSYKTNPIPDSGCAESAQALTRYAMFTNVVSFISRLPT